MIYKESWTYGPDEINETAQRIWDFVHRHQSRIISFTGPLGAGKTTLVSKMLLQAGVEEPVTSPTFAYVNIYTNSQGINFYHFDLYRVSTLDDFVAAGFDEYLSDPQSYVFIEWPAVIQQLLIKPVCAITIEYYKNLEKRILALECDI